MRKHVQMNILPGEDNHCKSMTHRLNTFHQKYFTNIEFVVFFSVRFESGKYTLNNVNPKRAGGGQNPPPLQHFLLYLCRLLFFRAETS